VNDESGTEIPANPERRNVTRIEMDFTYTGEETLLIIVRPVVDTALEFRSQGNFGLHRVSGYVKNNIIDQQQNSRSLAGRPICIVSGTRFAHTVTSSYKVHPVQLVFLLWQYFGRDLFLIQEVLTSFPRTSDLFSRGTWRAGGSYTGGGKGEVFQSSKLPKRSVEFPSHASGIKHTEHQIRVDFCPLGEWRSKLNGNVSCYR